MNQEKEILELIRKAGWKIGVRKSKDEIQEIIKQNGYSPFECVVDFLCEFNGLKILFFNRRNGLKDDDISFDFIHAASLESIERVRDDYELRIGKPLCLVGTAYRDYFVLMMSDDGNVYGAYDDFLCKIGDSGLAAIRNIVFDEPFIEIPK